MIKKFYKIILLTLFFNYIKNEEIKLTDDLAIAPLDNTSQEQEPTPKILKKKKVKSGYIPFSFESKNLVDLINEVAAKKEVNVILPQAAAEMDTIKQQKITYKPDENIEIPIDEAWDIIKIYLELSGYSLYKKKDNLYAITTTGKKGDSGITREPLNLFSGVSPVDLPRTDSRIVYIFYLRNLKVPDKDGSPDPIGQILKDMSSVGAPDPIYLTRSNGIVIVDKSNVIASMVTLLSELDYTGYKEVIEVVPLYHVPAADVAKVFETLRKAVGEESTSPFLRADTKVNTISYFAADTKIVPDIRNNQLILMGRESAVSRIIDFIHENVDTPLETGDSVLHYYDLQYLNAKEFAIILQEIVNQRPSGGGDQATQAAGGGPERYFEGVVVAAEEIVEVKTADQLGGGAATQEVQAASTFGASTTDGSAVDAKGVTGKTTVGGNRLIIAAMHDDWLRIKDLIESLDKPQPQVILECMIVDFTKTRNKEISTDLRNKTSFNVDHPGVQFLSSQISSPNDVLCTNPTQLAQDLLALCSNGTTTTTLANNLTPGSLLVSFNDPLTPGIFGLLSILDKYIESRVMSHPYIISTNNQKGTVTQTLIKRAKADAKGGQGGVTTIEIVDIPASIQVQMIPRLSSLERLSLQIGVDINEFVNSDSPDLTRITRRVETYANMNSGEILVIGGLNRQAETDRKTQTPILGSIPLIGWLFKGRSKDFVTSNVVVFISPTIVHTKLRDGLTLYTKDKIRKSRRDLDDDIIFNDRKDPITQLFFKNRKDENDNLMMEYLSQTTNAPDFSEIETNKEKKYAKKYNILRKEKLKRETKKIKLQDIPA